MTKYPGNEGCDRRPTVDRIRVLQVIHSLHFGGAEKVVAQLAAGLDRMHFDVRVACLRDAGRVGEQIRQSGIEVTAGIQGSGIARFFAARGLLRQIRSCRPHVVHTHGLAAITAAGPLAYLRLLPDWIHTFHYGNYPYRNKRHMFLERHFSRQATRLIAVAGSQRSAVMAHHGVAESKIEVIPNGVPPNACLEDSSWRPEKRAELGIGDEEFVFGTICVLSEQKGVTYLLDAAAILLRSHPRARFLIVGGGPLEAELRARAEQLALGDRVVFAGWRGDVQELILTFDVFVMPSLWEAMPLALLEAMAARRAIVVTDVGDNAEFVSRGDCGILVKPKDSAGLSRALATLADNRELVRQLGDSAYARYRSKYAVSHMIDAYQRLYRTSWAYSRMAEPG